MALGIECSVLLTQWLISTLPFTCVLALFARHVRRVIDIQAVLRFGLCLCAFNLAPDRRQLMLDFQIPLTVLSIEKAAGFGFKKGLQQTRAIQGVDA